MHLIVYVCCLVESSPPPGSETSLQTEQSASHFSALCWLYGKQLHAKLRHPIGLVSVTYADSLIEEWVPIKVLDTCGMQPTDR